MRTYIRLESCVTFHSYKQGNVGMWFRLREAYNLTQAKTSSHYSKYNKNVLAFLPLGIMNS